jgi:hypothetical protein
MTADNIIALLLALSATTPNARVMRDPEYRTEIAASIMEAESAYGTPASLLTAIAYHESSFDSSAVGKLGEIGLTQVHGLAASGCELESVRGQIMCGARWLAHWKSVCGGDAWYRPLVGYASGSCDTSSSQLRGKIMLRINMANRMDMQNARSQVATRRMLHMSRSDHYRPSRQHYLPAVL